MAKDFISDQEMSQLEKAGKAKAPTFRAPDFISDDDMKSLESAGRARLPSSKEEKTKYSKSQTALESYGNAATLGYLPHIQAALEPITDKIFSAIEGKSLPNEGKAYVERRDENLKRLKEEKKENPKSALAGEIAGIVGGGSLIGAAAPAKVAVTVGARVGSAAKTGAVIGGLSNPGDTEGKLQPFQPVDRFGNAALGAGTGAVVQGGLEGIGKTGKGISEWLKGKAEEKATRSLGRPTPTVAEKMKATGQDKELGRTLLDEGAIPVLGTPSRIAKRVERLKDRAGEKVGSLVKSAGDKKVIDGEALAVEFLDSPAIAEMRTTPGLESMVAKAEQMAETLAKNKSMSVEEAQKLRQAIDKSINFAKKSDELRGTQELLYNVRSSLRDKMDDAISQLGVAEKGTLKSANKSYGNLAKAEEILDKELARNQNNRAISLTDTIAGAAGASTGNPLAALGLATANKAGRTFGNAVQARSYNAISKRLAATPQLAQYAASNPALAQVALNRTGNPAEFSSSLESILDDPQMNELFRDSPELIKNIQDPKIRAEMQKRYGGRSPTGDDSAIKRRLNRE